MDYLNKHSKEKTGHLLYIYFTSIISAFQFTKCCIMDTHNYKLSSILQEQKRSVCYLAIMYITYGNHKGNKESTQMYCSCTWYHGIYYITCI